MSRILPILFNTEMTKAILDGRKAVTRRVVKRKGYTDRIHDAKNDYACKVANNLYQIGYRLPTRMYPQESIGVRPQYQVGNTLYVRETQSVHRANDKGRCYVRVHYRADDKAMDFAVSPHEWERLAKYDYTDEVFISPYWTTKETSRIWLKVTAVRAERLQDITEEQAKAEGCISFSEKPGLFDLTARHAFIDLWNGTLKKDSTDTWAHNPWVWVYEFERCEKVE